MVFDPTSTNFQLAMRLLNGVAGFFFSPSAAHVLVLRELLWREVQPLSTSFSFFLHVDSFMFAACLDWKSLTQKGEKPAKNIFAQWTWHTTKPGQEGSAKREMSFLSFVFFSEIEQRNFIRKGRRKHTNAVCKVSWCGKEHLRLAELASVCSARASEFERRMWIHENGASWQRPSENLCTWPTDGKLIGDDWFVAVCWWK